MIPRACPWGGFPILGRDHWEQVESRWKGAKGSPTTQKLQDRPDSPKGLEQTGPRQRLGVATQDSAWHVDDKAS